MAKSTEIENVSASDNSVAEALDKILVTAHDTLEITISNEQLPDVVISDDSYDFQADVEDLATVELTLAEGEIDFSMFGFGVISVSEDAEIVLGGIDAFISFDPLEQDTYTEDFII